MKWNSKVNLPGGRGRTPPPHVRRLWRGYAAGRSTAVAATPTQHKKLVKGIVSRDEYFFNVL
jgi:hypothetical protein